MSGTLRKVVSVKDFGAKGDGVADDTAALNAAIAHALSVTSGSSVFFPPGTYKTTSNIIISVDGARPKSLYLCAAPGTAIIQPSAAVKICLTLATESNNDGTCNWLKVEGLRFEGVNTTNAIGVLVGENAGNSSANIVLEDVQILRFAGGSGKGLYVKNAVGCVYTRCYIARSDTNLYVKGGDNLGLPTLQLFDKCAFRDGPGRGVDLVMGHRCSWRGCLFESNQKEGFYCVPGVTGDVLNCEIDNAWFETNWTGNAGIATRYHVTADGSAAGTLMLRIANSNFEGATRAIYWKKVVNGIIDNVLCKNAANQVVIDTGCGGTIRNWPSTTVAYTTALSNSSPTTFGAIEAAIILAAPSTAVKASINVPTGTAPSAPNDGDIWYDGTHFYGRVAGVSKQLDNVK